MRKNIVIIMTDQHRADVCKREGYPIDTTPYLDSMAKSGCWFENAYTTMPICAPARISMLTGRYPSTHRVCVNHATDNAYYKEDIFDVAKRLGYQTAMIGKNHSHLSAEKTDYWNEFSHDGQMGDDEDEECSKFDRWLLELNHGVGQEPTPFPLRCQQPSRIADDSKRWVESTNGEPFLLWMTFPEPHNPYQVPEPYFSMFNEDDLPKVHNGKEILESKGFKWQWTRKIGEYVYPDYESIIPRARANYFGMLRLIDDQIKGFVEFLESKSLRDDTLIVFMSDHGDFVGEYGLMRKGPEAPDILSRIPMIFNGPGIEPDEESKKEFISIADVFPTICEYMGEEIPYGVQGRSIMPILTGESYPEGEFSCAMVEQGYGSLHYGNDDDLKETNCLIPGVVKDSFDCLNSYSQSGSIRMLRKGKWSLSYDMMGNGQLYDLSQDKYETDNLFYKKDYQETVCELVQELLAWTLKTHDTLTVPEGGRYEIKRDRRNYWNQ